MSKKKKETRTKKKQHKEKVQTIKHQQSILSLLDSQPRRGLTLTQIIRKTGAKKKEDLKKIERFIDSLLDQGRIRQLSNGHYVSQREEEEFTGVVDHVSSRFAYINIGEEQDVYVKTKDLGSAVDGDTVRVTIFPTQHGDHPEGKVVEILKRNRNRFVGRIEVSANFAFVIPDFRKIHQDFFVYPENINGAKTNDKVVVEVVSWAEEDKKPEAKVVEILGKAGENEAEIHSIMAEFDLPFRFSEQVESESQAIEEGITRQEIKKRRDFRDVTTFTIDPEDAKDFDDALSFQKLD
ncbi:MAG TPA: ribonuclease R, partial [Chryseosolibacter sp.]|nr:ribonuclease R [Chryseosolibacter sp.]